MSVPLRHGRVLLVTVFRSCGLVQSETVCLNTPQVPTTTLLFGLSDVMITPFGASDSGLSFGDWSAYTVRAAQTLTGGADSGRGTTGAGVAAVTCRLPGSRLEDARRRQPGGA